MGDENRSDAARRHPAPAPAGRDTDATANADAPGPVDAGKTGGGGSLGHDQPDDVAGQARLRNQGDSRDQTRLRERQPPDPLPERKA
jgi:hypothetical protein